MTDAKKEAAKLQRQIGGLGIATLVKDQEGKLHVIPGCEVEIVGVYTTGLKQADLIEDISFSTEKRA